MNLKSALEKVELMHRDGNVLDNLILSQERFEFCRNVILEQDKIIKSLAAKLSDCRKQRKQLQKAIERKNDKLRIESQIVINNGILRRNSKEMIMNLKLIIENLENQIKNLEKEINIKDKIITNRDDKILDLGDIMSERESEFDYKYR